MNKTELIDAIVRRAKITKPAVSEVIDAAIYEIIAELARGSEVRVTGLGRFKTDHREARTGRNPQTGEQIEVAAKTVAKFTPEKPLRDAVNAPKRKVGPQRISPMPEQKRA
jgi:nucleoid DNA-binding protein